MSARTGFARRGGRAIGREEFARDVAGLARVLPGGLQVINLCQDRYRFAVGFAAALARGQVSLLPPSAAPDVLARLAGDFPDAYCLTDAPEELPEGVLRFEYPVLVGDEASVLEVRAEQVAAVLFTSGSTGAPAPHVRDWGTLAAAADAAGRRMGIDRLAGATLVGTVPHQHSYGLESLVLLALRHGLELECGRGFLPADICARLAAVPGPRVLVTTPLHLRLLLALPGELPPVARVVCATAPLDPELAVAAEARFGGELHEIYGCTEAGQIASRRTARELEWRCLDGFSLRQDAAGVCWARGPGGAEVGLSDVIEIVGEGRFVLRGRAADQIDIAGKRGSIAHLTHHLLAIEGVLDGAFVLEEASRPGGVARLAAVAVAPGVSGAAILAALRRRIDPAFLPRPLCLLEALPRDRLGKLARGELRALVRAGRRAGVAECGFAADHPAAVGHFPGNPVIPGAVLLAEIRACLAAQGGELALRAARFHQPVRPGDRLRLEWRREGAQTRFSATVLGADQPAVTGQFVAWEDRPR